MGVFGGYYGVSGVYWRAGRECRYSGVRRGIGGIGRHWELQEVLGLLGGVMGVGGVRGVLGAGRACRFSGQKGYM